MINSLILILLCISIHKVAAIFALFLFPPLVFHLSLTCSEDLHQNYSVFTGESNSQMEIICRNLVGPSEVRALRYPWVLQRNLSVQYLHGY